MSAIDDYLAGIEEPKRRTLQQLRETIREIIPDAEETISYSMPAFRLHGKAVAGFAAFKNHLAYIPFSGGVFAKLGGELAGYTTSKSGSLHFPVDRPLPKSLVKKLVDVRVAEVLERRR
jgi:uncharacterized protein YdhG (YjbR/CyaY superfamily)